MQRLNCSLIKYNEQILLVIHNYKKTSFIAFEDECENYDIVSSKCAARLGAL